LNDKYQTILLNPTAGPHTITLDPTELQRIRGGGVPNFWVILKNTSPANTIRINLMTTLKMLIAGESGSGIEQDIFISGATGYSIINIAAVITSSSMILFYDVSGVFGYGRGRFVFI
jgi:hypothetical protein